MLSRFFFNFSNGFFSFSVWTLMVLCRWWWLKIGSKMQTVFLTLREPRLFSLSHAHAPFTHIQMWFTLILSLMIFFALSYIFLKCLFLNLIFTLLSIYIIYHLWLWLWRRQRRLFFDRKKAQLLMMRLSQMHIHDILRTNASLDEKLKF